VIPQTQRASRAQGTGTVDPETGETTKAKQTKQAYRASRSPLRRWLPQPCQPS
jgi:hypothetical protein